MKKLVVQVQDDTKTLLTEPVAVKHMSDVPEGVKQAVEDFVKENDGVVLPPVEITVTEKAKTEAPACEEAADSEKGGIWKAGKQEKTEL